MLVVTIFSVVLGGYSAALSLDWWYSVRGTAFPFLGPYRFACAMSSPPSRSVGHGRLRGWGAASGSW